MSKLKANHDGPNLSQSSYSAAPLEIRHDALTEATTRQPILISSHNCA